jgi:hypothetical protein
MAKKQESRLQRDTRYLLEKVVGGVWCKIHGGAFQEPGIGDLMGCVCSLHIEVEMKTEDGSLRKSQKLRQRRILRDGGGAYLEARSPDEAVLKVIKWLASHGKHPKKSSLWSPGSERSTRPRPKDRRVIQTSNNLYNLPIRKERVKARKIS